MRRLKEIHKVQELIYELRVSAAMEKDVVTVSPQTKMSELRPILRSKKITGSPVMCGEELLGIISVEDYINWLSEGGHDCSVTKRMSCNVITLYEDEPLVKAIRNFEKYRYYEFPVIERKTNKLVGIVTKRDVITGLLKALEIDYQKQEIKHYKHRSHFFNEVIAQDTTLIFRYDVTEKGIEKGGEVASGLKKNLGYLGIHPNINRRVAIATYEAEMNLIIYGGGGEVKATLTDDSICIEVKDNGPGIPDIEKALKPGFSTAPNWVRELGFGAGMGLTNIQDCAEKFNLLSTVGGGTYLKIIIPLEEK